MFIKFGNKLLNVSQVDYFQPETMMGCWRIAAYKDDEILITEDHRTEELTNARMKMLENLLVVKPYFIEKFTKLD